MMTKKTRRARRRYILGIGKVNVIITYIIARAFVIIKYSSVIFISNLWKLYD